MPPSRFFRPSHVLVRARLLLLLVGLFLITLALPSWAGVVEDAQEVLQTLPADNPAQRALDEEAARSPRTSLPHSSVSSGPSGSSATSSNKSRSASGSGSRAPNHASAESSQSAPEESPLEQEARRRREARSSSDNALSLGGLFLLLILVVAAALYSRRAERHD